MRVIAAIVLSMMVLVAMPDEAAAHAGHGSASATAPVVDVPSADLAATASRPDGPAHHACCINGGAASSCTPAALPRSDADDALPSPATRIARPVRDHLRADLFRDPPPTPPDERSA